MSSPRCSLIVPVHNGLPYLRVMLETLRAHTPHDLYQLILSDDASDTETRGFLMDLPGWARVHYERENLGFASACNAGAQLAESEFLVFLNSDLEFRPGWLQALIEAADVDPRIAAVGAKLLYPDGTIQHGGVFLREDRLDRNPLAASHDHVGRPGDYPDANRREDLLAVTAAALLVRRTAFESVGGFDEGYFNGLEDVDLCLKLGQEGHRIVYEPNCTLVHHESKSGPARFAKSKANQRRFLESWLGKVWPEMVVTPYLEVGSHIGLDRSHAFEPASESPDPRAKNVRIVVLPGGRAAELGLTLGSIFGSQIGLYDRITVSVKPGDEDAKRYLQLCEGYDDAFDWNAEAAPLPHAAESAHEEYIAFLKPGTIVTQGWLARLIFWASEEGVGAAGPLLSATTGHQDAMANLPEDVTGTLFPNELSHAFARANGPKAKAVGALDPACVLMKSEIARRMLEMGASSLEHGLSLLPMMGLTSVVAHDVFVHQEHSRAVLRAA